MPVYCDISTELNLVIYICTKTITAKEFFKTGDLVALDPRLKAKMNIIIDFNNADLEILISDLHFAIEKLQESKQKGKEVGRTAILTKSTGLKFLGDALKFISSESPEFGILHTQQDVIQWLGLPEAETLLFWNETRKNSN